MRASAIRNVLGGLSCLVGGLGGLLCLAGSHTGIILLVDWVRIEAGPVTYFRYGYLAFGIAWTALSLTGAALAIYGFRRNRPGYWIAALLASAIGLAIAVSLPNLHPPFAIMDLRVKHLIGTADQSLAKWDESHGRFPSSQTELLDALAQRPLSEEAIFFAGSQPMAYEIRFVGDAAGRYEGAMPTRPGVLVYAVRKDFDEYWLTVTTLAAPVGGPVVFYHGPGPRGDMWIMNRTHHEPGKSQQSFIQ